MASKLKIDELRAILTKRGLDASGTKPELVERVTAVLLEELKGNGAKTAASVTDTDDDLVINIDGGSVIDSDDDCVILPPRKRPREDDDDDDDCVIIDVNTKQGNGDDDDDGVVHDVETLRGMGIRELRIQAILRRVSSMGTKKELFKRISACLIDKVVKATKKGVAVLDQYLPDDIKANYHVLENGGEIYDATLNRTSVADNSNKFHVIQVLEPDIGGAYMVFARGGRVGFKGKNKLQGPFTTKEAAIKVFERKFYAKTHNLWSSRKDFVCQPKFYAWLEMDYSKETENESVVPRLFGFKLKDSSVQPQVTQLESRVAKFISLICDVRMMKQQMVEIGYNAEKLPLGKLSKSTILKGNNVLKSISEALTANRDKKILEELTGAFYSVIPHDFGFKKIREFIIDTPQKLNSKIEMVEALREIELATKLLEDSNKDDILYSHYKRLQCDLIALDFRSKEYSMIMKYMKNTHAQVHSGYTVDIVHLFRVSRKGEDERFRKFSNIKNRMLLWHGSRLTNWTGILSQGLRIAPPEAPATGYAFGKGVYFADMFSKSAGYCYSSTSSTTGVLLLCEVALGEMYELQHGSHAAVLPPGKLSVKGVGLTAPDPAESQALDDGVVVPLGKPRQQQPGAFLAHNEYIVYNVDQIRMRYLIHVNFNYKS